MRWLREHSSSHGGGHDHHHPTGMGLRFINLPAEARSAIASFLKHRESIFFDDE